MVLCDRGPNVIFVGVAKCGTTSLWHLLSKNEGVFVPEMKECRFFSQMATNQQGIGAERFQNNGVRSLEDYLQIFDGAAEGDVKVDISNDYFFHHEKSIENILDLCGTEVKIGIMLRDPCYRAFSNYMHHVRDGQERVSFLEALIAEEKERQSWSWVYHYLETSRYSQRIKSYMSAFSNVQIFILEEFVQYPERSVSELSNFLGISQLDLRHWGRENKSGRPILGLLPMLINSNYDRRWLLALLEKIGIRRFSRQLLKYAMSLNIMEVRMSDFEYSTVAELLHEDYLATREIVGPRLDLWDISRTSKI